jgi:hypothetical protein
MSQCAWQAEEGAGIGGGEVGGALSCLPPGRRHRRQHMRQQSGLVALGARLAGGDATGGEVGAVGFDQQPVICKGREWEAICGGVLAD